MNEVNKTLYIPLYGKAKVSRQGIILKDLMAEKIWDAEKFEIKGKAKSKWLSYNMAMRAKVFDEWAEKMLRKNPDALVLVIGCGLDGRCLRVRGKYRHWIDGDFPEVIKVRKTYYEENENYRMLPFDASKPEKVFELPDSPLVIVIMEGISMYLSNGQLKKLFLALQKKFKSVHVLMDVYTVFGAKASKYKNPINEVGVTKVFGVDDIEALLSGTRLRCRKEHSLIPKRLVNELRPLERVFFKLVFSEKMYRKIYRLYELTS